MPIKIGHRRTPVEPQKRAHSPLLAAGLASESKNSKLPYGRRFPAACGGELQYLGFKRVGTDTRRKKLNFSVKHYVNYDRIDL